MRVRRFGKSVRNPKTGYITIPEVGHINNEGIPRPMTSRVSHPLMHARVDVRPAIERDDTSLVHHLGKQSYESGTLHNLQIIVIGAGNHRVWQTAGDASCDYAYVFP